MLRIAVIPGDGVGPEVVMAGRRVLERACELDHFELEWVSFDWGSGFFKRTGRMIPDDALQTLRGFDAIYVGAMGDPTVPEETAVRTSVIAIRQGLNQFANVRPVRLFEGVESPLRTVRPEDLDLLFIRENVEGEYVDLGNRVDHGLPTEWAEQISMFTRRGIERITRFAFEQAVHRRKRVTSITKSNVLSYSMTLWNEVVREIAGQYPGVTLEEMNVDAAAYHLILKPHSFDVILASNLFGDILTDIGAALQGSLGLAASANLDPTDRNPGMFEPVHGSAPDIAGRGIANPTGAIWSGALMLSALGLQETADRMMDALRLTYRRGNKTQDLGGALSTSTFTAAVIDELGG